MKAMIRRRIAAILTFATVFTSVYTGPVPVYASFMDITNEDEILINEEMDPVAEDIPADGEQNSYITWSIDSAGCLTVNGSKRGFRDDDGSIPWSASKNQIKSAKISLTGAVTDLSEMFEDCTSLKEVTFERINVTDLVDIHDMFKGCSSLVSINNLKKLSPANGSKITNMGSLFEDCTSLKELDLTGFDTENVINMSRMFYGCEKIGSLDVTGFDAIKVISMNEMFYNCKLLVELDLSSFNIGNAENVDDMLQGCVSLNLVRAPHNPEKSGKTQYVAIDLPNSGWVRRDTDPVRSVTSLDRTIPRGTLVTIGGDPTPATNILDQGKINDTVFWILYKTGLLTVSGNGEIHDGNGNVPWLIHKDEILRTKVDLSGTKDLSGMFEGCDKLSSNDLSGLDTSDAENMSYMFKDCKEITDLSDISGFDTSKVTKMTGMFENCISLTTPAVFNFDTLNVNDMTDMFKGCSAFTSLDLSSFDMRNINIPGGSTGMFADCISLNTVNSPAYSSCDIDLPGGVWLNNTTNRRTKVIPAGTVGGVVFTKTDDLECGDYANSWWWIDKNNVLYVRGTGEIHDISGLSPWSSCTELIKTADISLTGATDLSRMFEGCDKLTSITWTGFDTNDCTKMFAMFRNCSALTSVDLSVFNTSKVTEMGYMFEGCSALTNIDVSGFDTAAVFDMRGMFRECKGITELDLSSLDMSGVKNNYYINLMLEGSTSLSSCKAPQNLSVPITLPVIDAKGWKEINAGPGERVLEIPKTAITGTEYITAYDITGITLWDVTSNNSVKPAYDLNPGDTLRIRATIIPAYADPLDVVFSSSNTRAATVSVDAASLQNDTIEAVITADVNPGSSIITASFGNVKADPIIIRVMGAIKITPNRMTLLSGQSGTITAVSSDPNYPVSSLVWTCDDALNNITVSGNGSGAVVTARSGIKDEITVNVKAATADGKYEDICIISLRPDPNEKIEDWGDIDDQDIKDLFNNDPDNVPAGLWYLLPDNGNVVSGNTVYKVYEEAAELNYSRIYTGSEITLDEEINVYYGVRKLWGKRDYTLIYRNNVNAATVSDKKAPSFTVNGTGSFQNSVEFKFNIEPEDINNADLTTEGHEAIDNKTKIGSIAPVLRYKGTRLIENKDYELKYYQETAGNTLVPISNPKKWAAYTGQIYYIEVNGKPGSNFTGSLNPMIKLTTIDPKDKTKVRMSKARVRLYPIEWDGNPVSLNEIFDNTISDNDYVKVDYNKKELVYNTDFTVDSETYTDAGKYTFRIHGTENSSTSGNCYVGDKVVTLEIKGTPSSKVKIAAYRNTVYYTGEQITLEDIYEDDGAYDHVTLYTVKNGVQVPLVEGVDYDYDMPNSGSTGKFTLTFNLKGGYTGTITKTIRVFQYNIHTDIYHKLKVQVDDAEFCKAGSIPKVTVMYGNRKLDEGIDYTLSYKNNSRVGTSTDGYSAPSVTISGIGNFSGKITEKFSIYKAPMENIKMILDDKEYKEKFAKGYFKSSPRIVDGGRLLNIGVGKDIEPIPKNGYKYYYAGPGGQEIDIHTTHIDPNTLIEVRATITCSEESPYIAGTREIKGYYRFLEKTKDLRNATVYLEDPKELVCSDTEAEIRELLSRNLNISIKGIELVEDRDYKIKSVKNFLSPGTAAIEIEGTGQYGGTKLFTFKMYRRKQ